MNKRFGNIWTLSGMKSILIALTLIVTAAGFSKTAEAAIPVAERAALIDLYNSTNGASWTNSANWNGAEGTECTWYGVYCDAGQTHVTGLSLNNNNLSGNIPTSIGNLTNLTYLTISNNQLTGGIPVEIGNMVSLQTLYLSQNQLSGAIPSEIGNLISLQYLSLDSNQLSGAIPLAIGNLTGLHVLDLFQNQLSGEIPGELGNLKNLAYLRLFTNQLSGSIPAELGSLTNLGVLSLSVNQLSGAIPDELGGLTNLYELALNNNKLTGNIPTGLGNLSKLIRLNLSNNQLTGTIPVVLGNLSSLESLALSNNQLTGTIPVVLGNLSSLKSLALFNNQLTGAIPADLGNLPNLESLNIGYNQLMGTIPPQLGSLANLQYLTLGPNQLSGMVPAEIGNLANLRALSLFNNTLSGPIPSEICNLTNLVTLHLAKNQLAGTIPAEFSGLANLQSLYLYSNQLSGPLPSQLMDLAGLVDGRSDIRWNALYTTDAALKSFLDSKQYVGDWASTQTIAPPNLAVDGVTDTSVTLTWTAIPYSADTGGYEVYYSTSSGGAYTLFETTATKSATSSTVTGLVPGRTYYFKIRTKTNSHQTNQNTVYSEYTSVISSQTVGPNIRITDSLEPQNDHMMPFGNVTENIISDQTITIDNNGELDLTVETIAGIDTLAAPFSIVGDNCSGQTLAPSETCTLTIRFAPTAVGSYSDSFDIPSNDPDTPSVTISLSGTGLSSAQNNPPSAPVLVSPSDGQAGLGTSVEFKWKKSTDPDGDAVTYRLYYCTDQSFTGCAPVEVASSGANKLFFAGLGVYGGIMVIGIALPRRGRAALLLVLMIVTLSAGILLSACGSGGGGGGMLLPQPESDYITHSVSDVNPGATYYWKVAADDGRGAESESEVWSFGTQQ